MAIENIGDTLCRNCGHKKSEHTHERGYEGGCVVCACNGFYLDGDGKFKYGVAEFDAAIKDKP